VTTADRPLQLLDNHHTGWGLHVWSRVPNRKNTLVAGADWYSPVLPLGKTEQGGFFRKLQLADFHDDKVWYVIHKEHTKEQGDKDQTFDGKTVRQIWVHAGDPWICTSKEEAIKARGG